MIRTEEVDKCMLDVRADRCLITNTIHLTTSHSCQGIWTIFLHVKPAARELLSNCWYSLDWHFASIPVFLSDVTRVICEPSVPQSTYSTSGCRFPQHCNISELHSPTSGARKPVLTCWLCADVEVKVEVKSLCNYEIENLGLGHDRRGGDSNLNSSSGLLWWSRWRGAWWPRWVSGEWYSSSSPSPLRWTAANISTTNITRYIK